MINIKFSRAAQQNIEETGIDPAEDLRRLHAGIVTLEQLLAECLEGAEDDREQGWRDYVRALSLHDPEGTCDGLYRGWKLDRY